MNMYLCKQLLKIKRMKKIYLTILSVFISIVSFSQGNFIKNKDLNYKIKKEIIYTGTTQITQSKVTPFWTDDLSDPSLWTMTDYAHAGTQNWVITTSAPTGAYSSSMGAIASTTASNGFGLYDSDALSVSYTNVQDATLAYNNPIDCSMYQNVNIQFESNYRKFNDSIFIEVSNDNINWDRYEVHGDYTTNTSSANPENVSLNISPTAGGQTTVWFRFRFEGVWDYAWMVDDVAFAETPDNLVTIDAETFGGWWIGYQTVGGLGIDYTLNPMEQVTANPYRFEAAIANQGVNSQNNVTMHVDVLNDGGTSVYSGSSNPITLYSMMQDTFATTTQFTPSTMGYHQINFWASSDSFPTTDTIGRGTIVTDTVYGVDFDWNSDGQNGEGGYYLGRECGGQVLGNVFDIYSDTKATSISFHVNDQSVPGAELKVVLYEVDPMTTPYSPIYLAESDDYTLAQNYLDSWKTIKLFPPVNLYAGTSYVAAVQGYANPVDTSLISSSSNFNTLSFIQDNGCDIGSGGFGYWYSASKALMIRLNVNSTVSAIDQNKMTEVGLVNIYPNPNQGIFTLELAKLHRTFGTEYFVSISNILGQEVYSKTIDIVASSIEEIDLSNIEKGVYLIEINHNGDVYTEKLIIE